MEIDKGVETRLPVYVGSDKYAVQYGIIDGVNALFESKTEFWQKNWENFWMKISKQQCKLDIETHAECHIVNKLINLLSVN